MKKTRKGRIKQGKKSAGRQAVFPYMAELLVIALVVAAAFFSPKIIFRVQDRLLWGDPTLGQRENINVDSLSTTYEVSLGKRMQKYAEGLAGHQKFYLTSQELEADDTLEKFLYSEKGLYSDIILFLVNYELIPTEVWDIGYSYSVTQWKQYVIYNDNYEEGVNFILWYIEMQDTDGGILRMLVDAEDSTLYGLKTEGSSLPGGRFGYDILPEIIRYDGNVFETWSSLAVYYGALDETDSAITVAEKMGISAETDNEVHDKSGLTTEELQALQAEELRRKIENSFGYQLETGERICFNLPYGEDYLDAIVEIKDQEMERYLLYPDLTVGIRQIYQMIPEFA